MKQKLFTIMMAAVIFLTLVAPVHTAADIALPGTDCLYYYDLSSIDDDDLVNLSFVYLGACETGKGGASATNLVNSFYSKGVESVVGFKVQVLIDETNFWSEVFMCDIANGCSVLTALSNADYAIANDTILGGRLSYTVGDTNRLVRGSINFVPVQ